MNIWDGLWSWYAREFQEDPAGWISLFILVGGVVVASIFGRKIIGFARSIPGRIDRRLRKHYSPPAPVTPSVLATLAVTFVLANVTAKNYVDTMGRRQGGVINYGIENLGPMAVQDVWISLEGPQLSARSRLFWDEMPVGRKEAFTVHIPFTAERSATLLWKQDGVQCSKILLLPLDVD
ncbi:hypothetical protein [Herbiconiux sp.]|uniref:hypothetical protein n=1 Tax=Herbiconiux sp. TaxID=1871186 RepID=UPI0025BA1E27|nr:hypothetical protein [Herbiconiux sp.]